MMHDDWLEKISESSKLYMAFVCIDYVGSTALYNVLQESEIKGRFDFYRETADRIFHSYEGVGKGWSGEGNVYFFGNPERKVDEDAVKSSIDFLRELKVGIDREIPVRISINSGYVDFKKTLGIINNRETSFCGHLNSACPLNSIILGENTYMAISQTQELKDKFILLGTTIKDNVVTFIYPGENKLKKNAEHFLPFQDDNSAVYKTYLDSIEGQCRTLTFTGIRQMRKIPSIELTEAFFPLKMKRVVTSFDKSAEYSNAAKRNKRRDLFDKQNFSVRPDFDTAEYDFADVFRKHNNIVILGDPGSGKTTLLKWLCLLYSRGLKAVLDSNIDTTSLLPVLVPVSAIFSERRGGHINPVEAISNFYNDQGIKGLNKLLESKLEKGKCIILLDGLDEIPASSDRFEISNYIKSFVSRHGNNRFIITSRIIGYQDLQIPDAGVFEICHLKEEDVKKFTANWYTAFEKSIGGDTPLSGNKAKEKTNQLLSSINQDNGIKNLAANPFLLSLICLIQEEGHTLPRYRVELYRLCTETLFQTWLEARNLSGRALTKAIDYKEGEKILAPLALWLFEYFPGGMAKEEVIKNKIIEIMIQKGKSRKEAVDVTNKFFCYLAEQTQLIIPKGGGYYGFRHLTFGEFLAARALIMNDSYYKYLNKYCYDSKWTEVFLLTAGWIGIVDGREEEVTKIVQRLLNRKDIFAKLLHKNLLLAGKIVIDNTGTKRRMIEEIANKLFHVIINTKYETLKIKCLNIILGLLEDNGNKDIALQWIVDFVRNKKNPDLIREYVINKLSIVAKETDEICDLLISLIGDRKERIIIKAASLEAISFSFEHRENVKRLFAQIIDSNVGLQDEKIVAHLEVAGKPESFRHADIHVEIKSLVLEIKSLRGTAIEVLSKFAKKNKNIRNMLFEIAKNKNETEAIREIAVKGLAGLFYEDNEVFRLLLDMLTDKNEEEFLRGEAIPSIGRSLNKKNVAIYYIIRSIASDVTESDYIRAVSIDTLAPFVREDETLGAFFFDMAENNQESNFVRGALLKAISSVSAEDRIYNLIVQMINNKKEIMAEEDMFHAIRSMVGKNSKIYSMLMLKIRNKSEDLRIRIQLIRAISNLTDNCEVYDLLKNIAKTKNENNAIRANAIEALTGFTKNDKKLFDLLTTIVKGKQFENKLRNVSIAALNDFGKNKKNVYKLLFSIIVDKNEVFDVKETAFETLLKV